MTVYSSLLQLIRKWIITLKLIIRQKKNHTDSHSPICRIDYIKTCVQLQNQKNFGKHLYVFHFLRNLSCLSQAALWVKHQTLEVLQSIAQSKLKVQNLPCSKAQGQSNRGQQGLGSVNEFIFFSFISLVSNFKPLAFSHSSAPSSTNLLHEQKNRRCFLPHFTCTILISCCAKENRSLGSKSVVQPKAIGMRFHCTCEKLCCQSYCWHVTRRNINILHWLVMSCQAQNRASLKTEKCAFK